MEFSHVGSSSEVNETWSLCLRRVQHGVFLHELSGFYLNLTVCVSISNGNALLLNSE